MSSYKKFSNKSLNFSFKSLFEDQDGSAVETCFDKSKWEADLILLSENLYKSDTILCDVAEYLFHFWCTEAMNLLLSTEIPFQIIDFIIYFTKEKLINCKTPKEIERIAKDNNLISSLYIINECFKMKNNFKFHLISPEMILAFFTIYEFSTYDTSNFAISIITRYAEYNPNNDFTNLANLLSLNFEQRVLNRMKVSPEKSKIFSIYALIPIIKYPDEIRCHKNIIEELIHMQKSNKGTLTLFATLQLMDIYIQLSEKCLKTAVKMDVIDLAISGLETSVSENQITRKPAFSILNYILNQKKFPEFIEEAKKHDLMKTCWILLNHILSDEDIICGTFILEFLIRDDQSSHFELCKKGIDLVLCSCAQSCNFAAKERILFIFSFLMQNSCGEVIERIGEKGAFELVLESLETVGTPLKYDLLSGLNRVITLFESAHQFIQIEELCESVGILTNDENPDISQLAHMIIDVCQPKI